MTAEEEAHWRGELAKLEAEAQRLSKSAWRSITRMGAIALVLAFLNAWCIEVAGNWGNAIALFLMGVQFGGAVYRFWDQRHRDSVTGFLTAFRQSILDSVRDAREGGADG